MSKRLNSNFSNSFSWILILAFVKLYFSRDINYCDHVSFWLSEFAKFLISLPGLPQVAVNGFLLSVYRLPWDLIQFWSFKYHLHTHAPEFISVLYSSPQTLGSFIQCPLNGPTWILNDYLQVNIAEILFIKCTLKPAVASFFHISL